MWHIEPTQQNRVAQRKSIQKQNHSDSHVNDYCDPEKNAMYLENDGLVRFYVCTYIIVDICTPFTRNRN